MKKIFPIQKYHIALAALLVFGGVILFTLDNRGLFSKQSFGIKKDITIVHSRDNEVLVGQTRVETVCELLDEQGLAYEESDKVIPECDTTLTSDMDIEILPKLSVLINVDGSQKELEHHGTETLQEVLTQENIEVRKNDLISIDTGETLSDRQEIEIIRVTQEEVTETERILFQEVIEQSDQFTTDYEDITQEGEEGEEEIIYTITLHDGEEVEREESSRKVAKEKKDRIIIRGTKAVISGLESEGKELEAQAQAEAQTEGGLERELDIDVVMEEVID